MSRCRVLVLIYGKELDMSSFAEKISVYELAYRTPAGKPGRKQVSSNKVPSAVTALEKRGYYNIRVSSSPLYECAPVFVR